MSRDELSPELARALNFVGMMTMIAILLGAYGYQFWYRELPCTLCLLQRVAMMAVALGAAMNVMHGPDPRHYGICIVSSVFGAAVSVRQSLLHINPFFDSRVSKPTLSPTSNPPFGHAVLGFDLYIWGFLIFGAVIFAVGLALLFRDQFKQVLEQPRWLRRLADIGVGILFVVAAIETLTTFLECGFGDCPNDGSWNWWIFR